MKSWPRTETELISYRSPDRSPSTDLAFAALTPALSRHRYLHNSSSANASDCRAVPVPMSGGRGDRKLTVPEERTVLPPLPLGEGRGEGGIYQVVKTRLGRLGNNRGLVVWHTLSPCDGLVR